MSEQLIRALKAPSDPPSENGPEKIELALTAWQQESLYVPGKPLLLAEWILGRLLKDRGTPVTDNPIQDHRYWHLLTLLLSHESACRWLPPLLSRVPIIPTLLSFIELLPQMSVRTRNDVVPPAVSALNSMFPIALPKIRLESLVDGLWTVLAVLPTCGSQYNADGWELSCEVSQLIIQILTTFRTSMANATTNKTKIYTSFIQNHVPQWLHSYLGLEPESPLRCEIYAIGEDIIFGIDRLRTLVAGCDADHHDNAFEFLSSIAMTDHPVALSALPALFISSVSCLRKHKLPLFGGHASAASSTKFKVIACKFLKCFLAVIPTTNVSKIWETRAKLFHVVETERLFAPADTAWIALCRQHARESLDALEADGTTQDVTIIAISNFSLLLQLDYDIASPFIPELLVRLVLCREEAAHQTILGFLLLLLDYHSRTRTLDVYINRLAVSVLHRPIVDASLRYSLAASNPIFGPDHLEQLCRAVLTFLTPSQTFPVAKALIQELIKQWSHFQAADSQNLPEPGLGSKRKRKAQDPDPPFADAKEAAAYATTFALLSRIMAPVLSSLSHRSLEPSTVDELKSMLMGLHADVLDPSGMGMLAKEPSWARHLIGAASMRMSYTLCTSCRWQEEMASRILPNSQLIEAVFLSRETLPEFALEIGKSMLVRPTTSSHEISVLVDRISRDLRVSVPPWNGKFVQLGLDDLGHTRCAIALWDIITDRWSKLIDERATSETSEQVIDIFIFLFRTSLTDEHREGGLSAVRVLQKAMISSHFWELPNHRSTLLKRLDKLTAPLQNLTIDFTLATLQLAEPTQLEVSSGQIDDIIVAYRFLLLCPVDYLGRSYRSEFARRAYVADIAIRIFHAEEVYLHGLESRAFFRLFLVKVAPETNVIETLGSSPGLVEYMVASSFSPQQPSASYTDATLQLLNMAFIFLAKNAANGSTDMMSNLLNSFSSTILSKSSLNRLEWLPKQAALKLLTAIAGHCPYSVFPEPTMATLKIIGENLTLSVENEFLSIPANDFKNERLWQYQTFLQSWKMSLMFRCWLGETPDTTDYTRSRVILSRAAAHLCKPGYQVEPIAQTFCTSLFSLLIEELQSSPIPRRHAQIEIILAAYLVFVRVFTIEACSSFDSQLTKASKKMSKGLFSHMLDCVNEATSQDSPNTEGLIHLSTILLRDPPEGSWRITQTHTDRCLQLFTNKKQNEGALAQMLSFLATMCQERAMFLKVLDVACIWAILAKVLAGSTIHNDNSSPSIFHNITNISGALIRMRRDLVVLTIPHMSAVLSRLIVVLRGVRPQLGGKQLRMITHTLPAWISHHQPLGSEEARLLARLLTSLTTKTVIRTYTQEHSKAESLSRPFSKHAAYVLETYINAVNEPLCIFPTAIRKELEPGLHAICGMMGEEGRDALVGGLDAGGKSLLKIVWSSYEKQKYTGKG